MKTIYDPCPPGYRVPARDKETLFHSGDLTVAPNWAEGNNWFTLGDPIAVFPFAGYRDDYSVKKVCHAYDRAVYWTAYASAEDGGTAYPLRTAVPPTTSMSARAPRTSSPSAASPAPAPSAASWKSNSLKP